MSTHPIIAEDIRGVLSRTPSKMLGLWLLVCVASTAAIGASPPESPVLQFTRPSREIVIRRDSPPTKQAIDDTSILQAAFDNTNCVVTIPAGLYVISQPLKVHSRTWIEAAPEAVIRLAEGAGRDTSSFLLTNADPKNGNEDIVIEGGIWDGNNTANPRKREYHGRSYGGVAINFIKTRGLVLRHLTIRNPESFSIRLGEVRDFLVEDIRFDQSIPRPNQDGIHIGGLCSHGIVRTLRVTSATGTHDDMVALNADDDVERPFNVGMRCGAIHDILVEDLESPDAYTFVRLLSHKHAISNVLIRNIRGGFRTNAINADRWRFPAGGGSLRNVTVHDVTVHKTGTKPNPCIIVESGSEDLVLRDIRRTDSGQAEYCTLLVDNSRANRLAHAEATGTEEAEAMGGVFKIASGDIEFLGITSGSYEPAVP